MKMSRKHVSPGLSFAAGTFVGAFAVFVPLTSSGHPGSKVEGSVQLSAVRPSAHAADRNAIDADSASSMKQDSSASNVVSNETTCDVQLD